MGFGIIEASLCLKKSGVKMRKMTTNTDCDFADCQNLKASYCQQSDRFNGCSEHPWALCKFHASVVHGDNWKHQQGEKTWKKRIRSRR